MTPRVEFRWAPDTHTKLLRSFAKPGFLLVAEQSPVLVQFNIQTAATQSMGVAPMQMRRCI